MNSYKKIVVLLAFFISFAASGQDINEFYFEANTARKLAKKGKIDSAITTYENAFKKVDYVHINYLKRILKLVKLKEDEVRIKKYTQQIEKQSKGTSPKLIAVLDSLIEVDQKIRKGNTARKARHASICDYKNNCNKQSKRYIKSKIAADNWKKTDSLNTNYLLSLFEKHGFIGEELVGSKKDYYVTVMLLHFDVDTNNTVLEPVLEKARKEGKILPIEMSMILDRHLGNKYTTQKYWTWPCIEKERLQFSEADIPNIIKLRESIGIYDLSLKQEEYKGIYRLISKDRWKLVNYYID